MTTQPTIHRITPENPPQFRDDIPTWVYSQTVESDNDYEWFLVGKRDRILPKDTHWTFAHERPTAAPTAPVAQEKLPPLSSETRNFLACEVDHDSRENQLGRVRWNSKCVGMLLARITTLEKEIEALKAAPVEKHAVREAEAYKAAIDDSAGWVGSSVYAEKIWSAAIKYAMRGKGEK